MNIALAGMSVFQGVTKSAATWKVQQLGQAAAGMRSTGKAQQIGYKENSKVPGMSSAKGDKVNRKLQSSWQSYPGNNRQIKGAWEKFLGGKEYSSSAGLRPTIDDSWRRYR